MIGFKSKKSKKRSRNRKMGVRRKYIRYTIFGFVCYAIFLVTTFPASILVSFVKASPQLNRQIQITAVDGTLWNGSAANVRVSGVNLGQLKWDMKILPMLLGKIKLHINFNDKAVSSLTTSGSGYVSVSLGGRLTIEDFRATVSADTLAPLMYGMPARFGGDVNLLIQEMTVIQGKRINMKSRVVVSKARLVSPQKITYGDILIQVTPKDNGSQFVLSDQGGPLILDGVIKVKGNGIYTVNLGLGARSTASADLENGLRFIGGRRDSNGKYRYKSNGKLKNW